MQPLPAKPAFSATSPYWLAAKAIYGRLRELGASNPLAIAALANADMESAFKPAANGDDKQAFNVWQWWWKPRGARILDATGIDVRTETDLSKVVDALWWEMRNVNPYVSFFVFMMDAKTAEDAAGMFCSTIEGAGAPDAKQRRIADAAWWTVAIEQHKDFFGA